MRRTLMKSKIHRATVTEADLNYVGSITIDRVLMDAANLVPYEKVHVVNINNGARFETYVIEGAGGSGTLCLNGAAARLAHVGDRVIVIAYADFEDVEVDRHRPAIVLVDDANHPIESGAHLPLAGRIS